MPRIRKTKDGYIALSLRNDSGEFDKEILLVGPGRGSYLWIGDKAGACFAFSGDPTAFLKAALEQVTGYKVTYK